VIRAWLTYVLRVTPVSLEITKGVYHFIASSEIFSF
jgi:hypothetical protein